MLILVVLTTKIISEQLKKLIFVRFPTILLLGKTREKAVLDDFN